MVEGIYIPRSGEGESCLQLPRYTLRVDRWSHPLDDLFQQPFEELSNLNTVQVFWYSVPSWTKLTLCSSFHVFSKDSDFTLNICYLRKVLDNLDIGLWLLLLSLSMDIYWEASLPILSSLLATFVTVISGQINQDGILVSIGLILITPNGMIS